VKKRKKYVKVQIEIQEDPAKEIARDVSYYPYISSQHYVQNPG
jgi:hypothetical protein